ncbi:MAG TPA: L-seryl-tRNA(Sec) selenium transferase [Candidatus Anoxymicrobiaceae bacterium]
MNPPDEKTRELLRLIPQVNELAEAVHESDEGSGLPRGVVVEATRQLLDSLRATILWGGDGSPSVPTPEDLDANTLARKVLSSARAAMLPNLKKVINATGVVLHTNFGRAPLPGAALDAVVETAGGYCNLEYRLADGTRASRQEHLERLVCMLTGAGAAMAVNNNAAAVLLVLAAIARGREVIVSRGQLVEIGDSFRLPDIMGQSGARLVEVGTTNRTSLSDYSNAIGPDTALIMKIHPSNFRIVGYTEDVPLDDLVALGSQHFVPVVEDLGSGSLVDLEPLGLSGEHTAADSISQGADLVTFSGDKLLGGPQAGIIAGSSEYVEAVRGHPLARALRIGKMTIAALEATLRLYLDPEKAWSRIPALRMLSEPAESVRSRANKLKRLLDRAGVPGLDYTVAPGVSCAGGGSLPTSEIPTYCLGLRHEALSASALEARLRGGDPPVLARVKDDRLILDLRTVMDTEISSLAEAIGTSIT